MAEEIQILIQGTDGLTAPANAAAKSLDNLEASAKKAGGLLDKLGEGVLDVAKVTAGAAIGLGIEQISMSIAKRAEEGIDEVQTLGKEVRKLQRETGATAEQVSGLVAVFERYGMSAEGASRSLGLFAKRMAGLDDLTEGAIIGGKGFAGTMQDLGVSFATTDGQARPMYDVLLDVADKFREMPDGAQKTALAMQLFGRSGKDMLATLNQGREGILEAMETARKYGLVLTQENVRSVLEFGLAQKDMKEALSGLTLQLGVALLPMLIKTAEAGASAAKVFNEYLLPVIRTVGGLIAEDIRLFGNMVNIATGVFARSSAAAKASSVEFETATTNDFQALTEFRTKAEQDMEKYVKTSAEQVARKEATFGEAIDSIGTRHRDAVIKMNDEEAKLTKDYKKQLDDRLTSFQEAAGEQQKRHASAIAKMDEEEQKLTADYKDQLEDRRDKFEVAMVELATKHRQAVATIAEEEKSLATEFTKQMGERKATFDEAMKGEAASHTSTVAKMRGELASLQAQFVADAASRKARYVEEAKLAPDTYEAAKSAAASKAQEIQKYIDEEAARGSAADQTLLASLRTRLAQEKADQTQSYSQYLAQLQQKQVAEERAALDKEAKQKAALDKQLADENVRYKDATAKLLVQYDKDIAGYRAKLQTQQADLVKKRAAEDASFVEATNKGKAQYDLDVLNYQDANKQRLADLNKRRSEEDAAFQETTDKAVRQYNRDLAAYKATNEEKRLDLLAKRGEEDLTFRYDMAEKKKAYAQDAADFAKAEQEKLAEYKERIKEEQKAQLEEFSSSEGKFSGEKPANTSGQTEQAAGFRWSSLVPVLGPLAQIGSTLKELGIIPQAEGGSGTVNQPTLFLAGEAGPESFWFGGAGNSRQAPATTVINQVYIQAPVYGVDQLEDVVVSAYNMAQRKGRTA